MFNLTACSGPDCYQGAVVAADTFNLGRSSLHVVHLACLIDAPPPQNYDSNHAIMTTVAMRIVQMNQASLLCHMLQNLGNVSVQLGDGLECVCR